MSLEAQILGIFKLTCSFYLFILRYSCFTFDSSTIWQSEPPSRIFLKQEVTLYTTLYTIVIILTSPKHEVVKTYNEIDDTGIFKGYKSEPFGETSDHVARPLYGVDHPVSWKKFRQLTVREIWRNPTAKKLIISITCLKFNFISIYNTKLRNKKNMHDNMTLIWSLFFKYEMFNFLEIVIWYKQKKQNNLEK